jgi:hypothetical protein
MNDNKKIYIYGDSGGDKYKCKVLSENIDNDKKFVVSVKD